LTKQLDDGIPTAAFPTPASGVKWPTFEKTHCSGVKTANFFIQLKWCDSALRAERSVCEFIHSTLLVGNSQSGVILLWELNVASANLFIQLYWLGIPEAV
jgi:hypothetical protein